MRVKLIFISLVSLLLQSGAVEAAKCEAWIGDFYAKWHKSTFWGAGKTAAIAKKEAVATCNARSKQRTHGCVVYYPQKKHLKAYRAKKGKKYDMFVLGWPRTGHKTKWCISRGFTRHDARGGGHRTGGWCSCP